MSKAKRGKGKAGGAVTESLFDVPSVCCLGFGCLAVSKGFEKKKHGKNYDAKSIRKLRILLDEAYQQMMKKQFRYALYDARVVMEETVKMIIRHADGEAAPCGHLLANMRLCEYRHLLGSDQRFIRKLYEAEHICGWDSRNFTRREKMNRNKVYFAIMQIKDLLNFAERVTDFG